MRMEIFPLDLDPKHLEGQIRSNNHTHGGQILTSGGGSEKLRGFESKGQRTGLPFHWADAPHGLMCTTSITGTFWRPERAYEGTSATSSVPALDFSGPPSGHVVQRYLAHFPASSTE